MLVVALNCSTWGQETTEGREGFVSPTAILTISDLHPEPWPTPQGIVYREVPHPGLIDTHHAERISSKWHPIPYCTTFNQGSSALIGCHLGGSHRSLMKVTLSCFEHIIYCYFSMIEIVWLFDNKPVSHCHMQHIPPFLPTCVMPGV